MKSDEIFYGKCSFCGDTLTAGHVCKPLFPKIAADEAAGKHVLGIDFLFAWMTTPNPMLGNVTPLWMMENGRGEKLAKFIKSAIEAGEKL